jgi:4-amino-4-deoxy-L-arabinose transferase-like glycosyltransferase
LGNTSNRVANRIPILLIACVAIFLRVYAIDHLPPGLFGDEAVEGLDALDVLAGNLSIWFHAHLGREPLYVYLTALSYAAFGVTPLATRVPALIAGLLTFLAAYWFAREWALQIFPGERAVRIALLTTALLAISFWHVQMTRNAHRDTLLPLVESIGYALLWRAFRTRSLLAYAASGAVLGLAIYTYSPGRFVGVFVGVFVAAEFVVRWMTKDEGRRTKANGWSSVLRPSSFVGLAFVALLALLVMLPLGIYFVQNPVQFGRRFASVSIFDADAPLVAFATSVAGNLAQFVMPGAGYQSWHYNLPGKPVFDLLIAPWFLAGLAIALTRWQQPQYRFLLLWFGVMMTPAFLTADMIPKGVRVLGVVPGVFVFPALAMEWASEKLKVKSQKWIPFLPFSFLLLTWVGSAAWTTYDYFIAWANAPQVPLKFDADMVEVSDFIQRQPANQPIYVSAEVYRHPTFMLLGKRARMSQYFDRATRIREFDARTMLVARADEANALYVFVRDYTPPEEWRVRVAPHVEKPAEGEYFAAYRFGALAPPQRSLDFIFNALIKLTGYSRYADEPCGIVLYWQIIALPTDRAETECTVSLLDERGALVTQDRRRLGYPPMEWAVGDTMVEWYALDAADNAPQFTVALKRGAAEWRSPALVLR